MAGISITTKTTGVKELQRKLRLINPEANDRFVRRALVRCGIRVQKIASEEKIAGGGTQPGGFVNPPMEHILTGRTGNLQGSIRVDRHLPKYVDVGTDLVYGRLHELGIAPYPPRPFLSPALNDAERQFADIFRREWEKEIRR